MSPRSEELDCAQLVELVTDYLEGTLPAADRRRFEEHVAVCEGCEIHLDQVRRTLAAVGALREDDLPRELRDRLLAAFASRPPASR